MDSKSHSHEETATINISESDSAKGKTSGNILTTKKANNQKEGWRRGVAIFDFILRICAIVTTLAATTTMGTTGETIPLFTQFFQVKESYDDLPAFLFFVVANGIASGYLVLSLPFSIAGIVRPHLVGIKLLLLIIDTIMVAFTTAGAAAAAAIVYLARNGNSKTNWVAICQRFNTFCQRVSGAVIASFIAALIFIFLVIFSALSLRRHSRK